MIFFVSKDHSGKLVNCHPLLNLPKKPSSAIVNQVENLNDQVGKLVNCHPALK